MKTLYCDCYAGISGDMTVAALLDLGVPLEYVQAELEKVALPQHCYTLSTARAERRGLSARVFEVAVHDHHTHRHYGEIDRMIAASGLQENARDMARRVFRRLAEAEALVHRVAPEEVHFHEVGAIDSIVDIVGAAICLDYLNVSEIYAAPLPLGGGFVETAHGRLPVPAPATAELLKGLAVHGECGVGERVTPTGAAILAALATASLQRPEIVVEKIGSGAGKKDFPDCPNILRLFLGKATPGQEQLLVLESNIDDSTPQLLGYAMERLFEAGALDVWFTPIQMKKNRPAVTLSLLCPRALLDTLCAIVLSETSAIGVRHYPVARTVLERKIETVQTRFGEVRFKTVSDQAGRCRFLPEYDDCRAIALEQRIPLQQVMTALVNEKKESV